MFLDSRTTADSVAESTARGVGLRTTFRDVFLDNEISVAAIRARFRELITKARAHGSAVGIGHPYAQTLQVLAEELPQLVQGDAAATANSAAERSAMGIRLVPLSRLIARRSSSVSAPGLLTLQQYSASLVIWPGSDHQISAEHAEHPAQ